MAGLELVKVSGGFFVQIGEDTIGNRKIFAEARWVPMTVLEESRVRLDGGGISSPDLSHLIQDRAENVLTFITDEGRFWVVSQEGFPFKLRGNISPQALTTSTLVFPPPPTSAGPN